MAVSVFVCGAAGGSSSSLVIPITTPVPRSDPVAGATLILVFIQFSYADGSSVNINSLTDDATPQDDYSSCIFTDGLNNYNIINSPPTGLIVNDLTLSNSLTLALSGVPIMIQAVAIAVTGVGAVSGWGGSPLSPTESWLIDTLRLASAPFGGHTSFFFTMDWGDTGPGDAPQVHEPSSALTDQNWQWTADGVAIYQNGENTQTSDPLGWTWADPSLTDLFQYGVADGVGRYLFSAIAVQDPVVALAQGPSVVGAYGSGASRFFVGGSGHLFSSGAGPVCTPPPPPLTGNPTFDDVVPGYGVVM